MSEHALPAEPAADAAVAPPLAAVLATGPLDVEAAIEGLAREPGGGAAWRASDPRGTLRIELRDAPWDDEAPSDPSVAPGSLERAAQQPHLWPAGAAFARRHRAHALIRFTPASLDPLAALDALTDAALALLADPRATALFFPRGEALRDGNVLGGIRAAAREQGAFPLQAFTNGRIADPGGGWRIADLVGLAQLGAPDHEAAFPAGLAAPFEVLGFLYDVAHHVIAEGGMYRSGLTLDGPGGKRWMARRVSAPLVEPPRPCCRWMPLGASDVPEALLRP